MLSILSTTFFSMLISWMIVLGTIKCLMAEEVPEVDDQPQGYCLRTHDGREYESNLDLHKTKGVLEPCMFWEDIISENETKPENITIAEYLGYMTKNGTNTKPQNFCRNLGDFETPYCFSLNSSIEGEQSCPIPFCPELYHYRTSSKGLEYQGKLDFSNCQGVCEVQEHLGLSCPVQFQGNNGKLFTKLVPCDVPMHREIPVFNETHRERTVFIPSTTWYVPMSHRNISFSGSGELMLYLPDSSKFRSYLNVNFQIRLADPLDIDSFHFHLNFLPGETFEDYFEVRFSKEGVEIQRIRYKNETLIIQEEITYDSNGEVKVKRQTETRILKKTYNSKTYKKLPILKLRHDWLVFEIKFSGTRISLYFEKESEPIVQLKLPLGLMGMNEYQVKNQYVIRRFKTPRYVNFHSVRGTNIVALTKVNNEFYTCIEGRIKIPSEDDHIHIHPMAAMPLMYSDNDNPLDEDVKNRGRKLCLHLTNTPALIIFFSAPIHDSKNTDALKEVVTLLLEVQREALKITQCMNIRNINLTDMDISCDSNTEFVSEIKFDMILPVGEVLSLCAENYQEERQSIVRITAWIREISVLRETVLKGSFLRYWTLMKKRPSKQDTTLSQLGPLGFHTFHNSCTKYKYINPLLSYCLMQTKEIDTVVHTNYTHQITWSKSGKSCFPWSYFKSHLVTLATNNQGPEKNFCLFAPMDTQNNRKNVHEDFWCHVDLKGTKEMCEIPRCIDIITDMGCLSPVKDELRITPASLSQSYLCNSNFDFQFYLTLNVSYENGSGIRSQILNPEKGLAFYLRSMSFPDELVPVCFYLYCDLEIYPLIEFKISNSSLYMGMGHLGVSMNYVEVSSDRHSYYLNTWSFNAYTISQTAAGWHLFHGDDLYPSITYNTSHQLTRIQLSSCNQNSSLFYIWTTKLIAVNIEPVLNNTEIREILEIQALEDGRGARVNRFYPVEKSIPTGNHKITHMLMQTKEALSLWYILYKQIPMKGDVPILRLQITETSVYVYTGNSKEHTKYGNFKTGFNLLKKFYKLDIDMEPLKNKYKIRINFKSVSRSVLMDELPSYYGMEVINGEVKIVLLNTDE